MCLSRRIIDLEYELAKQRLALQNLCTSYIVFDDHSKEMKELFIQRYEIQCKILLLDINQLKRKLTEAPVIHRGIWKKISATDRDNAQESTRC